MLVSHNYITTPCPIQERLFILKILKSQSDFGLMAGIVQSFLLSQTLAGPFIIELTKDILNKCRRQKIETFINYGNHSKYRAYRKGQITGKI